MNTYKLVIVAVMSTLIWSCGSSKQVVEKEVEDTISESVDSGLSDLNDDILFIAEDVSAEKFKILIDQNDGVILDVRTSAEYASGHIEKSINLDYYNAEFKNELKKLDKTKAVYVYCKSGGRSGNTKKILTTLGFETIYNLKGGYSKWPYK